MMKKTVAIFSIAALVLTAASCKKNAALTIDADTAKKAELAHKESGKLPDIKFETTDHDFGTINEGDKVDYTYKFTNTGNADLIIADAKASCGCTIPEYTKTPVKPGANGEIKVVFNSAGKTGMQQKTVTLTLNTEKGTEMLNFKAEVTPGQGIGLTRIHKQ